MLKQAYFCFCSYLESVGLVINGIESRGNEVIVDSFKSFL